MKQKALSIITGLALAFLLITAFTGCRKKAVGDQTAADEIQKPEFTVDKLYERGPVQFRIKIDKTAITIAEKIKLVLESTAQKSYVVAFPELVGQLGNFSIKENEILPAKAVDNENIRIVQTYILEPFLSGTYKIPVLTFKYWAEQDSADNAHIIETEEVDVNVKSLLPEDLQKLELKDITGTIEPPPPNLTWVILLGCGILVVIGGSTLLIIRIYRRRARMIAASYIAAHELAFRQLQALVAQNYIEQAAYKLFYTGISNILEHYIENRFRLQAPESTTEEFLATIRDSEVLDAEKKAILKEFLKHCDMVKFAELIPTTEQIQRAFDLCKNFIQETQDQASKIEDKGEDILPENTAPAQVTPEEIKLQEIDNAENK